MIEKISLEEKFGRFSEHWQPRIVGDVNDCQVKLVKLLGEFVWHRHETEDEMFLVVRGRLAMHFRDYTVDAAPGEFIIVPRGVEHKPVADEECEVMLFEPNTVLNTGNVVNACTVAELERI
jgi:mannose-6-phosphate isomerase-like protein (cupin superfamily)